MSHADPSTVTNWRHKSGYFLEELAEIIPFGWRVPRKAETGVGRMVDLFTSLMRRAGDRGNIKFPVQAAAMTIYQGWVRDGRAMEGHPFTLAEVRACAKVVERYRRTWEARGWHHPNWINRQRARGRKGNQARRAKTASRDQEIVNAILGGRPMREVARERGLAVGTVHYIMGRDCPLFQPTRGRPKLMFNKPTQIVALRVGCSCFF